MENELAKALSDLKEKEVITLVQDRLDAGENPIHILLITSEIITKMTKKG